MQMEKPHGSSVASEKHPERNEDSYFICDNGAMGVFDGLGSHPGSAEASRVAAQFIGERFADLPDEMTRRGARNLFVDTLEKAHDEIIKIQRLGSVGIMATAMIAQVFRDPETERLFTQFAYSGDSRGYVIRNDKAQFISLDHSGSTIGLSEKEQRFIQKQLSNHDITEDLDPYDWPHIAQRNSISTCLGTDGELTVSARSVKNHPGDFVLLTSDGIHDNLMTSEIVKIVSEHYFGAPEQLIDAAQRRSREPKTGTRMIDGEEFDIKFFRPKKDDMTAVIRQVYS